MPTAIREHLYAILMLAMAVLLIVGVVVFWAAVSVEAYLAAGCLLAAAGVSYAGAKKLDPGKASEDFQALADYLGRKKTGAKDTDVGN